MLWAKLHMIELAVAKGEPINFYVYGHAVRYVPERTCNCVPVIYQSNFYDEWAEEYEATGCSYCEEPICADWSYCPHCGAKVISDTDEDIPTESAVVK